MDFGHIIDLLAQTWRDLDRSEKRLIFEAAAFFIILWRLKRSRVALQTIVQGMEQTLKKRIDAIEDAVESSPAVAPARDEAARWEQIRVRWRDVRDRMEHAIDNRIDDGRKLRKYSNLTRHSYAPIIKELRKDLKLSGEVGRSLEAMNERFLSLRRSRSATEHQVQRFEELYQQAVGELPTPLIGTDDRVD